MSDIKNERESADTVGPARILVIDDEEVIHSSLERLLGRKGHVVECVFRASEGVQKLQQGGYDLVITDLMMPQMNGLDLLEKMKDLEIDIPVLMVTGYPTIKTAMQAMRLGAVDYIAKPFRRKELLGPVNRLLRRGAREQEQSDAKGEQVDNVASIRPGDCYVLSDHSWVQMQQDGTARIGIEDSFLQNVGCVQDISLPHEAEIVEQGYVGIRIVNSEGEQHGVFMPLSGQVVTVNEDVAIPTESLDAGTWLVQIVPSHFQTEKDYLRFCKNDLPVD